LVVASHEINETATDPFRSVRMAYAGFDADHLAYEFLNSFQDELGDVCEATSDYMTRERSFTYPVQRQWSNISAREGHDPCVPVLADPYYDVTVLPNQQDAIHIPPNAAFPDNGPYRSKGFKVALHTTRTFRVGYFSDAPTSGPWSLKAIVDLNTPLTDPNGNQIPNGTATVSIDRTSGSNGDIANVTVTPLAWSPLGVVYIDLRSSLPGSQTIHHHPILVSAE
jgi:hypothetical protein